MKKENSYAETELASTTISDLLNENNLQVNGHYVPDDDEDNVEAEDDLVLGDEDEMEGDEAEFEVDLEDDAGPANVSEDDLVLGTDNAGDDDDEDDEEEV